MRSLLPAVLAVATLVSPVAVAASDTATGVVVVSAQFGSRTALKVSARLLRFEVTAPGQPATVSVEFSAGARTPSGAEVVLSVEPVRGLDGPGGAADVESSLSFSGEGAGTLAGAIESGAPTVVGRWIGSGLRTGRLLFSLRAAAPGTYTVPVRFVLSTP